MKNNCVFRYLSTMILAAAMLITVSAPVQAASALISKKEAIKTAVRDAGVTTASTKYRLKEAELELENGISVWEIEFNYGKTRYEYEIHAKTKAIISKDVEIGKAAVKKAMLKKTGVKAAQVVSWDIDHHDKKNYYAVVMVTTDMQYTTRVDAATGKVKKLKKTENAQLITREKAIEIARKHLKKNNSIAGKITVIEAKLDTENGTRVYEIELKAGGAEYDYDINALTGAVVKWEKEND